MTSFFPLPSSFLSLQVRARMACEVLDTVDYTQSQAEKLRAPSLIIHNTLDTMTDADGSRYVSYNGFILYIIYDDIL